MSAEVVSPTTEARAPRRGLIRELLARVGVGGRLLFAFLGISVFAVLAAAAGMIGFFAIGESLDRITEERVPAALNALTLSRQVEQIVAAAPAILTAETATVMDTLAAEIEQQTDSAYQLLAELQRGAVDRELVEPLVEAVDGLSGSLRSLQAVQETRLQIRDRKQVLLARLTETHRAMDALVAPWLLVVDEEIQNVRRGLEDRGLSQAARAAAFQQLDDTNDTLRALLMAKVTASLFKDRVQDAANLTEEQNLRVAKFRLNKLDQELAGFAESFDPKLKKLFVAEHEKLRSTTSGPDNIIEVQARELGLLQDGAAALALNVELSEALQGAVDALVERSRAEIDEARDETARVRSFSGAVFVGAVGLSLLSSVLVVWLYVGRRIVRRLRTLSDSMLAVAGGNLRVPLPAAVGNDEIAEMTRALTVFRDTAIEIEGKGLREIESARQRLVDAIESISEGFAFYDAEDRLALSNARYQELLYGGTDIEIEPGTPFEFVVRRAVERGLIPEAGDDPEGYVQERLARHRDPGPPTLQERADGRWVLIAERRVTGGGMVAVYSDITEVKRREIELQEANRRTNEVAEQISRSHRELEALSSKLAKYLSPQVYASIFSGAQQVELASQRKKLTVFFSDIEGFTETTDVMESEDLTRLLNEYLTEMSQVALKHGGTIDKYVGDAIMIFFGDPESRGVEADALACVEMAIAMQKRMLELGAAWRDAGIERPLACRIGIHTGYCTVGNFGSDDRMDYTIIGGAVNLASRLEHEAPAGGILISYETHAHVKDEVRCEEMGSIQVRGISHPVATYRVVDLHTNLSDGAEPIRGALPHLRLDAEPSVMSAEERAQAVEMLRAAAERLARYR